MADSLSKALKSNEVTKGAARKGTVLRSRAKCLYKINEAFDKLPVHRQQLMVRYFQDGKNKWGKRGGAVHAKQTMLQMLRGQTLKDKEVRRALIRVDEEARINDIAVARIAASRDANKLKLQKDQQFTDSIGESYGGKQALKALARGCESVMEYHPCPWLEDRDYVRTMTEWPVNKTEGQVSEDGKDLDNDAEDDEEENNNADDNAGPSCFKLKGVNVGVMKTITEDDDNEDGSESEGSRVEMYCSGAEDSEDDDDEEEGEGGEVFDNEYVDDDEKDNASGMVDVAKEENVDMKD